MSLHKAFALQDELIKINPMRTTDKTAYAIGFRFSEEGNFVATYNLREIAQISKELFDSLSVGYLASMIRNEVEMAY